MQIKISDIHFSPFQLRPVRQTTLEFIQLYHSIERGGLLQPILVRPSKRYDGFEVVDGAHRLTIYQLLKRETIECMVRDMSDEEVLSAQVAANTQRIKTLDSELARRLWRMAKDNDIRMIASVMGKSVSWVQKVCNMERLKPVILKLFDLGKITFRQACLLARIPRKHQEECIGLDEHQLKHVIRELRIGGSKPDPPTLSPIFRSLQAILEEENTPTEAGSIIMGETDGKPVSVWRAALRWVMQLDEPTKKRRRKKLDNRNHAD